MIVSRYLAGFLIGTVVGVLNEWVHKDWQPCYQKPDQTCVLTCGICNAYGWAVLGMTAYFDLCLHFKVPTALMLLAIGPVLGAMECAMGKISMWWFNEQRWKYDDWRIPLCNGSVSIVSTVYFTIAGFAYWFLYKNYIMNL
jgi:hypothetical protein